MVLKRYLIDKILSYIGLTLDYDEELLENIGLAVDFEYMMDGSLTCHDQDKSGQEKLSVH